jgi:hypothetical protein
MRMKETATKKAYGSNGALPVNKLYSLQSRTELHVIFECSQKVKPFCGSLGVQATSLVGLNEIRSMVPTV